MCKLKTLILLVGIIPLLACQQDNEDPPDLVEIATGYCKTIQMCDPNDAWESQEACESYSADEFKRTKTENRKCYDARIIMETCLGAFESCDEYSAAFKQNTSDECRAEFSEFSSACIEP
ncbi:MAG: hypothetical protein H0T76_20540 [Nannocystis sp.]|nr:hypothetical protein [Nannocystis sp.]MBA3548879.1 hypothetical protein [Nannocystis sp.]